MVNLPLKYVSGETVYTVVDSRLDDFRIDVAATYGTTAADVNTAVVQANANATAGSGPTTVYLREGVWAFSETVFLLHNVTIAGAGMGKTIIRPTGAGMWGAFRWGAGPENKANLLQNLTLRDMSIDGTDMDEEYTGSKGVQLFGTSNCVFERLDIHDTPFSALALDYPKNHTVVTDCFFRDAGRGRTEAHPGGGNGLGTVMGSTDEDDYLVSNCVAINCRSGVVIEIANDEPGLGRGTVVTNFVSIGCDMGFENAGTAGATFNGCIAIECEDGFKFGQGDHVPLIDMPPGLAMMTGCISLNSTRYGVWVFFDGPQAADSGSLVIQSSIIADSGSYGVHVSLDDYNAANLTIRNSTITGNATRGISLVSTGTGTLVDLSIHGNDILDNGTGLYVDTDIVRGLVEGNALVDTTGSAQTTGINAVTGRTIAAAFAGGRISATTPVTIAATLTGSVGLIPGWTRGAGAPTVTAPKGTVYQRSDGAAATLLYVNTDGATTWAAFA